MSRSELVLWGIAGAFVLSVQTVLYSWVSAFLTLLFAALVTSGLILLEEKR